MAPTLVTVDLYALADFMLGFMSEEEVAGLLFSILLVAGSMAG